MRSACIIGGGIAGTATAIALGKIGFKVELHEKRAGLEQIGAGIQISPNALSVLEKLDLDILPYCQQPEKLQIFARNSAKQIKELQLGDAFEKRFGYRYAVCPRATLHAALWQAATKQKNIELITNSEGPEQANWRDYDVIIGADGVHSKTRTALFPRAKAKYSGYSALRTPNKFMAFNNSHMQLHFGAKAHAVCYPIGKQQTNVVIAFKSDEPKKPHGWEGIAGRALVEDVLTRLNPDFANGLQSAKAQDLEFSLWPIFKTPSLPQWHQDNICLIGDAAHGLVPFAAQGAAMALEDAWVLAQKLDQESNTKTAFQEFQLVRKTRVNSVRQQAEINGLVYHIGRPASSVRNFALKSGITDPFKRLRFIYDWRAD